MIKLSYLKEYKPKETVMKYIALILGILFLASSGLGIWYYRTSQQTIQTLTSNNAQLELGISLNEETIEDLETFYSEAQERLEQLNEENILIRRRNNFLVERFADSDISVAAEARPELVERLINRGTANAFRCLELLSGSPLSEQERNATNGQSFNPECHWLFDTDTTP